MARHFSEAPYIRCPGCTHRFLPASPHWEMKLDHEIDCEKCGRTLVLEDEERVRTWTWATKPTPPIGTGEGT